MNSEASSWIAKLRLEKHPEGGYFVETYRSDLAIRFPGHRESRHLSSAIYYMLVGDQFSAFHRIKSDEIWHHYAGGTLALHVLGKTRPILLGKSGSARPQAIIPKGKWIAVSVKSGGFCLAGCTVSPGFDFSDWELGNAARLAAEYPAQKKVIEKYAIV